MTSASPPALRDGRRHRLAGIGLAAGDHHLGAERRHDLGGRAADALARAGDDGHLAGEIERVLHGARPASLPYTLTCCQGRGPRLGSAIIVDSARQSDKDGDGRAAPLGEELSAGRALGCADRDCDPAGDVRCLHGADGRPSRPSNTATSRTSYAELRAAVEARSLRADGPRRRPRQGRCALPAEHAPPPVLVLRRPQGRRAHRAPLAARCRARAGLQAEGLRRARAGHHQHRLHGAAGAEAEGRRAGRPPDRRRRHGVRTLAPSRPRRSRRTPGVDPLRGAARARAPASCRGSGPSVGRRGHRAAAVHGRHDRQAQGRHADATPTSAPPARSTSSGAIRSACPRPARTR